MILAIDAGNTRIKAAVFEGSIVLEGFVFLKTELEKNIQNILILDYIKITVFIKGQ